MLPQGKDDPAQKVEPERITAGGVFASKEHLAALGDPAFPYLRTPQRAALRIARSRRALERAIDAVHSAIMRQDPIPCATLTRTELDAKRKKRS